MKQNSTAGKGNAAVQEKEKKNPLSNLIAQVHRDSGSSKAEIFGQKKNNDKESSRSAATQASKNLSKSPDVSSLVTQVPRSISPRNENNREGTTTGKGKGRLGGLCGCVKRQESAATDKSPLLGSQRSEDEGKRTLVLDLDETLVHSSFRPVADASIIVTVEIEGKYHDIFVLKRPGVDIFLKEASRWYEIVIFTASLAKYADPLMDQLDPDNICAYRLFRESCTQWNGSYVKDLSRMGRHLDDIIILDNSPLSYVWQPDNAIPIRSWFDDFEDRELYDLIPILQALAMCSDIPQVLRQTIRGIDDPNKAQATLSKEQDANSSKKITGKR
eukprot:Filipodium_phascolosomae@DN1689_c0_g1_i1.p1